MTVILDGVLVIEQVDMLTPVAPFQAYASFGIVEVSVLNVGHLRFGDFTCPLAESTLPL